MIMNTHFTTEQKNTRRGFTLVELVLYLGVTSIMLFLISTSLGMLLESRVKNQTIAEVEQQGMQAMYVITQAIQDADLINTPATQGASSPTLSLNTYTVGNNPTVFDLSAGVLRITEGAGAPVDLTNAKVVASSLAFENLTPVGTPGDIRVQFTLTYNSSGTGHEYIYEKVFEGNASMR